MYQKASFPMNFLGLEPPLSDFANARVLVWPVPFEKTVSYGTGTSEGPAAIIEASRYIELYDEDIGGETAQIGIHTLPAISTDYEPDEMMPLLEQRAEELIATNKFLCMLGGEHSISAPVVRAMFKKYPRLSVMQIDAHADLRELLRRNPLKSCINHAPYRGSMPGGSGRHQVDFKGGGARGSNSQYADILCQGHNRPLRLGGACC